MMGIDVDRVIVVTFFIGSVLAGAAGVMVGLVFCQVYHLMGFIAGLKGFTAAVIGGIGSIPGAMLGGLVIGLAEASPRATSRRTLPGPDRLLAPDRRHARAPDRAPRQGGHPEGMSDEPTGPRPTSSARAASRASASTSGSRARRARARYRRLGAAARALERIPLAGVLLLVVAARARCFPLVTNTDYVIRSASTRCIFMLLALGLNVVVGWAGLLDLGYVAFFGFGAYMLRVPARPTSSACHWPARGRARRRRRRRRCSGSCSGCRRGGSSATTSRS